MRINKHINKFNWCEIKDILPDITEIKSLDLSYMGLIEFPKMSHIIIKDNFDCHDNQLTSFKDCPIIKGDFNCSYNQITSFENCPPINGRFYCHNNLIKTFKYYPIVEGVVYSGIPLFDKIYNYSRYNNISLLEAQVELYNKRDIELLEHIDKFPDLIAYIRLKELNKLL